MKNVQESLEQALVEVEAARSQQDVAFHQNTAKELEQRLKGMMLVVKVCLFLKEYLKEYLYSYSYRLCTK